MYLSLNLQLVFVDMRQSPNAIPTTHEAGLCCKNYAFHFLSLPIKRQEFLFSNWPKGLPCHQGKYGSKQSWEKNVAGKYLCCEVGQKLRQRTLTSFTPFVDQG
jgi:hypothetical protein